VEGLATLLQVRYGHMNLAQKLADRWRSENLRIRPPATRQAIELFEQTNNVILSSDLRTYFLTVDGMDDELDSGMNRFWPLTHLKLVENELTDIHGDRWSYPGCFVFVDHCIWCLAWAVRLNAEPSEVSGPVFQVTGSDKPGREVAPSFSRFLEMYLQDCYCVL